MIIEYEGYQDYAPALPLTRTEKLLDKVDRMILNYESGNNWKIGCGLLATPGFAGLILGGGLGLNPLIGLAFLCGSSGAIAAWVSYTYAEATENKALPKFGLFTGDHDLLPQLTGLEQLHYLALERFGVDFVHLIEGKGWLPQLLVAIREIDLSRVPDDQHDRYHHRAMEQIHQVYALSAAPETQHSTTTQIPEQQSPRGLSPEPVRGNSATGAAIAPDYFDWRSIKQYPHLMIVGSTGEGKSTLANWLLSEHFNDSNIQIIDPHYKPGTWENRPVIGKGRRYEEIETAFDSLTTEMDKRYQDRGQGRTDWQPLTIAIDEFPSIVANTETVKDSLILLGQEARKVGMRIILLSQGAEVKILGLEGKGSQRDNFCQILLGKAAQKAAKISGDTESLAILKSNPRACLVDGQLGIIPEISKSVASSIASTSSTNPVDFLQSCLERSPEPAAKISRISSHTPSQNLEFPLQEIVELSKSKGMVKARDVQNNIAGTKKINPNEIREIFCQLEDLELGYCDGEGITLGFAAY